MKVTVLGGAGFIGSHLADRLSSTGAVVSVVDNLSSGRLDNIQGKAETHIVDIRSSRLNEAFRLGGVPDAAVLLAAQTSVSRSCVDPLSDARTNILGLINAVQICARIGVSHVVFSSSAAVYGEPEHLPIAETHPTNPQSPYAISKLVGELYLRNLADSAGTNVCIMRFSNVYGPRQRSDGEAGVVSVFADRFARSHKAIIYGDGSQTRDFIYVKDVVDAVVHALERKASGILNISTGASTSIMEVYETMGDITGKRVPIEFQPPRPGDIMHSRLDNRKAMATLGWEPRTDLREGLENTMLSMNECYSPKRI